MKNIIDSKGVVVFSGTECTLNTARNVAECVDTTGVRVDYSMLEGYTIVETSVYVEPSKNKIEDGKVITNPDYVAPAPTFEEQLETLKAQNAQMVVALVQGGLM